jgi:ammonia channel protein AmtB
LLRSQVVAVLVVIAWSAVFTTLLLLIVGKLFGGLDRNADADKAGGLDLVSLLSTVVHNTLIHTM